MLKQFIPSTLIGRSIIIIFVPIIILVLLTVIVFYQTSWNIISKRLAESVVADINVLVKLIDDDLQNYAINIAEKDFKMKVHIKEEKIFYPLSIKINRGILSKRLEQSLTNLDKPFTYDLSNLEDGVIIKIQLDEKLLIVNVNKDRLYSETAFVFLLWMFFASLILLVMSYFLMNKQLKPLKRLAIIAETFGRGLDAPELSKVGAYEIRQTSQAFNQMRTRIKRFLKQRTEMLAGVSHDLRTPLTRMKLQIAFIKDKELSEKLGEDINEMEKMLNEYLQFTKSSFQEKDETFNLTELIDNIIKKYNNQNISMKLMPRTYYNGRKNLIKRCVNNLVDNAVKYGTKVNIELNKNNDNLFIKVEDDGPGIPEKEFDNVFKPFYKISKGRADSKSSVGLGLSIASDIIRSHGGNIRLEKSPMNGLGVKIFLPV